jgi:hypothetical protein
MRIKRSLLQSPVGPDSQVGMNFYLSFLQNRFAFSEGYNFNLNQMLYKSLIRH